MSIIRGLKFIGCVLVVAGGASAASAATLCVDPSDAGCSATIQAAVDSAAAGDTIEIADGLYFESVLVPAGKDGLVLSGGTIDPHSVPYDPNAPVDPNDPFGTVQPPALRIESNGVRVESLRVQNGVGAGILVNANGVTLEEVLVRGPENTCVRVIGDDAVISGSVLRGCGGTNLDIDGNGAQILKTRVALCDSDCINVDGDDALLEGNVVSQAEDGTSVRVNGDNLAFRKNKVSNGDNEGLRVSGDDAVIESNKFIDLDDNAIDLFGDNPTIRKNTVTTATDRAIDVYCVPCTGGLIVKNKVSFVSGDSDCFEIYADGSDPNDPNAPTSPFVVEGNVANQCSDAGFDIGGNGITARKNSVKDSGGDDGEEGFDIRGTGHTLEANSSTGNFSSGYEIEGTGHILRGNKATANLGDGFVLKGFSASNGAHVLEGNKANDNLGQGFAFTQTDPGNPPLPSTLTGNSASGNRTDLCVDEGNTLTLTDNDFDTTSTACLIFK